MLEQIPPKDRWVTITFACLFFAVTGFIGARSLKQPAQIVLKPQYGGSSQTAAPVTVDIGDYKLEPQAVEEPKALSKGHLLGKIPSKVPPARTTPKSSRKTASTKKASQSPPKEESTSKQPKYSPLDPYETLRYFREGRPSKSGSRSDASRFLQPQNLSRGTISLNSAGVGELDSLPGIGPVTARAILDYRREIGRFSSVDQLLNVKGIGTKKLAAIRSRVRL